MPPSGPICPAALPKRQFHNLVDLLQRFAIQTWDWRGSDMVDTSTGEIRSVWEWANDLTNDHCRGVISMLSSVERTRSYEEATAFILKMRKRDPKLAHAAESALRLVDGRQHRWPNIRLKDPPPPRDGYVLTGEIPWLHRAEALARLRAEGLHMQDAPCERTTLAIIVGDDPEHAVLEQAGQWGLDMHSAHDFECLQNLPLDDLLRSSWGRGP